MAEQMKEGLNEKQDRLLRLNQILELIPISKSTWWAGVASGRFPEAVHLGPRVTCWRESEVLALIAKGA